MRGRPGPADTHIPRPQPGARARRDRSPPNGTRPDVRRSRSSPKPGSRPRALPAFEHTLSPTPKAYTPVLLRRFLRLVALLSVASKGPKVVAQRLLRASPQLFGQLLVGSCSWLLVQLHAAALVGRLPTVDERARGVGKQASARLRNPQRLRRGDVKHGLGAGHRIAQHRVGH
eukprot:2385531-Prymnesium_polylepis.1